MILRVIMCLKKYIQFSLGLCCLSIPIQVNATNEFIDPIDGMFDASEYLAENAYGFLPVPIVMTEPALGYGGGFFGLFLHESKEDKIKREQLSANSMHGALKLIPPAVTMVGGAATENGTWFATVAHRRTWKNDAIRYFGAIGYANINVDIYSDFGVLPNSLFKDGVETSTKGYGGIQHLLFRVNQSPLLIGFSQFVGKREVTSDNRAVDFAVKHTIGKEGTISGLGLMAEYDTTDNYFFPNEGTSVTAKYMLFRDGIGSDEDYDKLEIEAQKYFSINSNWGISFDGTYESVTTDENTLSPLTRPYIQMRGIARYRYQDNYVASIQSQVVWKASPRWKVLAFGGLGSAEAEFDDLYSDVEYAYGTGFRYLIARRYGINMGVDIATSDEENAFYFNVGSGF